MSHAQPNGECVSRGDHSGSWQIGLVVLSCVCAVAFIISWNLRQVLKLVIAEGDHYRVVVIAFVFMTVLQFTMAFLGDAVTFNYVYKLFGDRTFAIGIVPSASNTVSIFISFLAGWIYDLKRQYANFLLRLSFVFNVAFSLLFVYAIYTSEIGSGWQTLRIFIVANAAIAFTEPFAHTVLGTGYTNAFDVGDRGAAFTYQSMAALYLMILGRIATAGVAARHGFPNDASCGLDIHHFKLADAEWTFDDMRWMIITGSSCGLIFAPAVLMMPEEPPPPARGTMSEETANSQSMWETLTAENAVLFKFFAADTAFVLVGGVLVPAWPVYMLQYLKMDPITLQVNFLLGMLLSVQVQQILVGISEGAGRIIPIIITEIVAVAALFGIAACATFFEPHTWAASASFVILFQIRIIFRGVSGPLFASLTMDLVPESQRGRWQGLGSIHNISGAAAAAAGGFLIEIMGYTKLFVVIACLQAVAVGIFLAPQAPRMNELEQALRRRKAEEAAAAGEKVYLW
jgi:MFS family permease